MVDDNTGQTEDLDDDRVAGFTGRPPVQGGRMMRNRFGLARLRDGGSATRLRTARRFNPSTFIRDQPAAAPTGRAERGGEVGDSRPVPGGARPHGMTPMPSSCFATRWKCSMMTA